MNNNYTQTEWVEIYLEFLGLVNETKNVWIEIVEEYLER